MGKWNSRKLLTALLLTLLATLMFVVPISLTAFGLVNSWILLTADQWIALVTMLMGGYFTSNIVEKHKSFNQELTKYNDFTPGAIP